MHFGWMHIIFNMMWLRQLGGQVESNAGTLRFLAIFAATAAGSNLAQYWLFRPEFGGMSGVNYALFGYVWMHSRYAPNSGYALTSATTWLMMGWLVWCGTGLAGPVANAAHAFGLIAGLGLALPSYLRFRNAYQVPRAFEKGSWQDLNIHGFERFRRLYFEPFAPAWFLVIALLVVALDDY
jgi:GlpG protein